ncbi:MAG: response regulator [Candidatus Brocadiales bacterium]
MHVHTKAADGRRDRAVSPEAAQKLEAKSHRILVVDDEKVICNFLERFLSKEGYVVKAVDNGAEAIRLLKSEAFDLVLCDLAMPGVSGWEVIRELEGLDKKPKVGLVTGWGEVLNSFKDGELPVDFVIEKPIKLVELTACISETLLCAE